MTLIGEIYRDGLAVRQDVAEAVHWYRLASALGDKQAAFQLGVVLLDGAADVPKDRAGYQGAPRKRPAWAIRARYIISACWRSKATSPLRPISPRR